jgi:hypothetical protein
MPTESLREQIESQVRENLIKDFNKLYVRGFTTTWEVERISRQIDIKIMKLDNTVNSILALIKDIERIKR